MPWAPPQPRVCTKDLLPVPPATNVKLALGPLLTLQILDRGVVFKHQLQVELYEVVECEHQQHREAPNDANKDNAE